MFQLGWFNHQTAKDLQAMIGPLKNALSDQRLKAKALVEVRWRSWGIAGDHQPGGTHHPTWRIIPVSKWLVTLLYKPFRPFIRGITPVRGLTNHGY